MLKTVLSTGIVVDTTKFSVGLKHTLGVQMSAQTVGNAEVAEAGQSETAEVTEPNACGSLDRRCHCEHPHRLLHEREVLRLTSLSRATLWRQVAAKKFPAPVHPSTRRSAWIASEVQEHLAALASKREPGEAD